MGNVLDLLAATGEYLGFSESELADFLPQEQQRTAWRAHHAWLAMDYRLGRAGDEEGKYVLLAGLATELLDGNCTGFWIPKMQVFRPNDDEARVELRALSTARPVETS